MMQFTEEAQALAKPAYEVIQKISKGKWEWKPEVGEWGIWQDKAYVIYEVEENIGEIIQMKDTRIAAPYDFHYVMRKSLIPLLHWERIERLLEGMGYEIGIDKLTKITSEQEKHPDKFEVIIEKAGEIGGKENWVSGSTRQEAVMRALLELGKERT